MKHHKIIVRIPYGRVVEFRKWCQAHEHIVFKSRPREWEGSYGSPMAGSGGPSHARVHWVYLHDPVFEVFFKLGWNSGA